jgi:hypothetical protein
MSRVIVICVESSKQAGFDDKYIDNIIKYYYGDKNPIRYVNMDGKGNYNKRSIKQNIQEKCIGFKDTVIIFAIDLDYYESNYQQKSMNERVNAYVDQMNYQLVWFYPNIEHVLVGEDIEKSKKRSRVTQFTKNQEITFINSSYLESPIIKKGYSNILLVLDKYLQRKR